MATKHHLPCTWFVLVFMAMLHSAPVASAADNATIKAERREAQKQRQQQKSQRNRDVQAAAKEFREFSRALKKDYSEQVRQLDTGFKLQSVDLRAERDSKIALADQSMQQAMTQLVLTPGKMDSEDASEKLKDEIRQHVDKVFAIKKQAAKDFQEEELRNERRKHELLNEQDQAALARAKSLGLLDRPVPILAEAIGGELTKQEQTWNEREARDTERLFNNNQRLVKEFEYGARLREWEMANREEDFELSWQQKQELHNVNSEQLVFNFFTMAAQDDGQTSQQSLNEKLAEMSTQTRLINIKYQKIKDKNRIKRKEEKRQITGR